MSESRLFHEESKKTQLAFAEGFVEAVNGDLNDIKHSFFRIGFRLHEAVKLGYYKTLGYANITDLALDKFGFSKSSTYEFIGIYELAHSNGAPMLMAPQYDKFSQSQLRELCRIKYDPAGFMRRVKPSDKVADIGKAVTFWNKYVSRHSTGPDVDNISDLLMLDICTPARDAQEYLQRLKSEQNAEKNSAYAEKLEYQNTPQGQLPGQIGFNLDEPEDAENSAYAEDFEQYEEYEAYLSNNDLIKYCLTADCYSLALSIKFEIYDKYLLNESMSSFVNFVRERYGNFSVPDCGGRHFADLSSSKDRLTIRRIGGGDIILTWSVVAGRISRFIQEDIYLTDKEKELFRDWKAEREAPKVELAPDEEFFQGPEELEDSELGEPEPAETETPPAVLETVTAKTETNREYLASLPTDLFVDRLLHRIIQIYQFKGSSAEFVSTLRPRLIEWLHAEKGALK